MSFLGTILSAVAGSLLSGVMNKSNTRDQRKAAAGSIRDRLKIGEEYGIHPLSMLGTSGNSFGTGGTQGAGIIGDAISQGMARKEQKRQESRADAQRWEDHQNNVELLNMRLQSEDARASRAQQESKFTPDAFKQGLQPWLQPYQDLLERYRTQYPDGIDLPRAPSYKDPNWRN